MKKHKDVEEEERMQVEVKNLGKTIKGNVILDNVDLRLESGKIYGLYGRNGSGKTMLLRCLAGLLQYEQGVIDYDGKRLHEQIAIPPNAGVMIENVGFWSMYTGFENLKMLAAIRRKIDDVRIRNVIAEVGLDPADKRNVSKYSLGMRQRLAIAQALMEYPDILLLDEPTNALDEEGILLFRNLLQQEKKRGCIVVLASHNKEDIDQLADVRLHMVKGRLECEDGGRI